MEAWSLHMLALSLVIQQRAAEAKAAAREALALFQEAGDVAGITLVLDDLSGVALFDNDLARAGRMWGAARHLQEITGSGPGIDSPRLASDRSGTRPRARCCLPTTSNATRPKAPR